MLRVIFFLVLITCICPWLHAQVPLRNQGFTGAVVAAQLGQSRLDSAHVTRQRAIHDATLGAIGGAIVGAAVGLVLTKPSHPCRLTALSGCGQGSSRASVTIVLGVEGAAVGALLGAAVGWIRSSRY